MFSTTLSMSKIVLYVFRVFENFVQIKVFERNYRFFVR